MLMIRYARWTGLTFITSTFSVKIVEDYEWGNGQAKS